MTGQPERASSRVEVALLVERGLEWSNKNASYPGPVSVAIVREER